MIEWRKSSFSGADANCVEIGWRKSSFSAEDSNCVELARDEGRVLARDSKNPDGPRLKLTPWALRGLVSASYHQITR